jgi:DNA-binding transcriptional regulator of glucitol operon
LAFTRGARTKASATESKREGRFTQAGAVGVQRLVGRLFQRAVATQVVVTHVAVHFSY